MPLSRRLPSPLAVEQLFKILDEFEASAAVLVWIFSMHMHMTPVQPLTGRHPCLQVRAKRHLQVQQWSACCSATEACLRIQVGHAAARDFHDHAVQDDLMQSVFKKYLLKEDEADGVSRARTLFSNAAVPSLTGPSEGCRDVPGLA